MLCKQLMAHDGSGVQLTAERRCNAGSAVRAHACGARVFGRRRCRVQRAPVPLSPP